MQAGSKEVRELLEARRRAARAPRRADDLLPRRDPPLQQGAAGRAAAGGRGGARDARGRHDREPLLRGQLGAALALPDLRAARAVGRRRAGAARARPGDERGSTRRGRRRRARLPRRSLRRRRAHGAVGARAGRGGGGRPVTLARGRGRAPAQGRALRQGRRPHYDLDLRLDQVHARLGPRRVAALPRGDARGRRGRRASSRAGWWCWRARTSATPTRGRSRWRWPRRTPSSTSACRSARSTWRRRPCTWRWRRSRTPRTRRCGAPRSGCARTARCCRRRRCRAPPTRARGKLGRGKGYDYPHDRPEGVSPQELMPAEAEGERFLELSEHGEERSLKRALAGDPARRAGREADPDTASRAFVVINLPFYRGESCPPRPPSPRLADPGRLLAELRMSWPTARASACA